MFEKVKQNRVFQEVAAQLEQAILHGHYPAGEKLPSERELKDTFGVGRGAVREAFRVLEQKGLVEIRLGVHGGAIVKPPSSAPILESLSLLVQRKEIPFVDIQEFRVTVESQIASLAAERRNEEDIEKLSSIVQRCKKILEEEYDWDNFLLEEGRFHQELAQIARNQLFSLIADALHKNIHSYYQLRLPKEKKVLAENVEDLGTIMDAVREGDQLAAQRCMREHLERFNIYMTRTKEVV